MKTFYIKNADGSSQIVEGVESVLDVGEATRMLNQNLLDKAIFEENLAKCNAEIARIEAVLIEVVSLNVAEGSLEAKQ